MLTLKIHTNYVKQIYVYINMKINTARLCLKIMLYLKIMVYEYFKIVIKFKKLLNNYYFLTTTYNLN